MKWEFVYDEGLTQDALFGILSNGKSFLFFSQEYDSGERPGMCRIYSSISFSEDTIECEYPATVENDSILLGSLNELGDDNYCGEGSPIRVLKFNE